MRGIRLSKRRRLTGGGTDHDQPAFSPDGIFIAFAEGTYRSKDLFLVDRRGRFVRRLTDQPGDETQPCFSPDGTAVAYTYEPPRRLSPDGEPLGHDRSEIQVVGLEPGSRARTLLSDASASFRQPAYAPDGRRMAYFSDEGSPGNFHLFILDLESGARTQLTNERNRNDSHAAFSPDGRRVAFHAYEGLAADRANICVLEMLDGAVERVTDRPGLSKHPSFADARTIVFHREEPGRGPALFAVDTRSGREWRLSPEGAHEKQPSVVRRRDGSLRVAFVARVESAGDGAAPALDIWRADLDGIR